MKHTISLLLCCLTFFLSGCGISQSDYDALVEENSILQTQVESLESKVELLQIKNQNLENHIQELETQTTNPDESSESETSTQSNAFEDFKEQKESSVREPNNVEIISYAQTIIEDFYPDSKFPFNSVSEYNVVKTNLRYKIEGTFKENKNASYEDFCMIIEFVDDNYKTYDLISLQVGKTIVYELQ